MAQTGATPAISAVNSKTIVTTAAAAAPEASGSKKKGVSLDDIAGELIDPRTGKKSQLAARFGDTTLGTNPINLKRRIGRAVNGNGVPNKLTTKTVIPDFSNPFGGTVNPRALDEQLLASGLNLAAPGSQPFPPFFPSFGSQGSVGGGTSSGGGKGGSGKSKDSSSSGSGGSSGGSSGSSGSTGANEAQLAIAREAELKGRLDASKESISETYIKKRNAEPEKETTNDNDPTKSAAEYLKQELNTKLQPKTDEDLGKAVDKLIKDLERSQLTDDGRKKMIQEFIEERGLRPEQAKQLTAALGNSALTNLEIS